MEAGVATMRPMTLTVPGVIGAITSRFRLILHPTMAVPPILSWPPHWSGGLLKAALNNEQ